MDELKGMIALNIRLAKMDGHKIDKKCARVNEMADFAVIYNDPLGAVAEVVSSAIVGDPMHISGTPLNAALYSWMTEIPTEPKERSG